MRYHPDQSKSLAAPRQMRMIGQKNMLRALMNVRPPRPVGEGFLKIQDGYLLERNRERDITDVADLELVSSDPRFYIWQGDITTLKCDAIVNACNSQMLGCFSPLLMVHAIDRILLSVYRCVPISTAESG